MKKMFLLVLFGLFFLPALSYAQSQTAVFNLGWTDNSGNNPAVNDQEDGFNIERRLGQTGVFAKIGAVGSNVVKYSDTIVNDPGNSNYCYRVQAFKAALVSPYSNIACATSPLVTVAPGAAGNVTVNVTVTVNTGP